MKIKLLFHSSNGGDQFGHVARVSVEHVTKEVLDFVASHPDTTSMQGFCTDIYRDLRTTYVRFATYADMAEFKLLFADYFE